MQAVTDQFKTAVNSATRNLTVTVKLIGKNDTDYTNARIYSSNDYLLSLKIIDGQTTGGFSLGGTICPSLTVELYKTAVVAVGDKVKTELVVAGGGNLTMASEFTVDNIKRKADGSLSVTALGNMVKLSKNYVSELTYPTTQLAVLEEIAEQTGYELHSLITTELINDPVIQSAPVKGKAEDGSTLYYTRREMLGYAAAINGGAAYIDQYGKINIARHNDTGETFTHERVLKETLTEPFEINSVLWNSTGLSYSLGDDYNENTIEFFNPLVYNAREQIAHNLETDLIGFSYDGAIIKKQGCGYYEVGDIVHYVDISGTTHDLLILGIVYEFTGGYFSETLYSLTNTAMQREYAGQEVVSNQIGGGQAQQPIIGGTLAEYGYISDVSVKCNGTIYSVEKDVNGLISKVTDDRGGELVPTVTGEITDVALHNALVWAVAMARGLATAQPNEHEFIMSVLEGMPNASDYTIYGYFIYDDGTYTAFRFKPSTKLTLATEPMYRDLWNSCIWFDGSVKYYTKVPRMTAPSSDTPHTESNQGFGTYGASKKMLTAFFSEDFTAIMPYFDSLPPSGTPFDITTCRPQPRDFFTFSDAGAPTGVLVYKWGSAQYVRFYYEGTYAVIDYTEGHVYSGTNNKLVDIAGYIPAADSFQLFSNGKKTLTLAVGGESGDKYFDALVNNLDTYVYWNSEDLCDENGNVLLEKNCDLSMWL